jgi:hypothetical protein
MDLPIGKRWREFPEGVCQMANEGGMEVCKVQSLTSTLLHTINKNTLEVLYK